MLKNKTDKTCLLIDMTIPLDTNTSVKTTEKLNKKKTAKNGAKTALRARYGNIDSIRRTGKSNQRERGKL